jgi:hypothetical protein
MFAMLIKGKSARSVADSPAAEATLETGRLRMNQLAR